MKHNTTIQQWWPVRGLRKALCSSALGLLVFLTSGVAGLAANVLVNPGFEQGMTGWSAALRGGTAVIITNATEAHSGSAYYATTNAGGWSSAAQGGGPAWAGTGVSTPISSSKYYRISAWVRSSTGGDVALRYRWEPSATRADVGNTTVGDTWTQLTSGWLNPPAGDNLLGYFEVHTLANGIGLAVDDCVLEESDGYAIAGTVKDDKGAVIAGAQVQLKYGGVALKTTTTGTDGKYSFTVEPTADQSYTLNASKIFYSSPLEDVAVATVALPAVASAPDIVLTALPLVRLSGVVTNKSSGTPVVGATLTITGDGGSLQLLTGAGGTYSTQVAANASLTIKATRLPLASTTDYIYLTGDTVYDIGMNSTMIVGLYATNLTAGPISVWTNQGTLGGVFGTLTATRPEAGTQGQYKAVYFDNAPMVLTNESGRILAPSDITSEGAQNYTVSAWLYEPDATLPDQQTYIAWGKRGGPDGSNCEMVYGVNAVWGAAGHWGGADMPWGTPPTGGTWHHVVVTFNGTTETDYIDGVFSAKEDKTLQIGGSLPIVLGSGYWYDATTFAISPDVSFSGYMAQVEILSAAASQDDVTRLNTQGPPALPIAIIAGKVVTSDASAPSGFTVKAINGQGVIVATAVTPSSGSYTLVVASAGTYTLTATKLGYVTMPGPQSAAATIGSTTTVGDFTAIPTTISGVVKDSVTGTPIYNAVVQAGDASGPAIVTESDGAYTLQGFGCGGAEVYADAVNYAGRRLLVTGTGTVTKTIQLVAQAEPDSFNGDMENLVNPHPAPWVEAPWQTAGSIDWSASSTARHGTKSLFFTPTATPEAYAGLYYAFPLASGKVYNFYFRAKADAAVARWQPMIEFDNALPDSDPNYIWDGFVSADTNYFEYAHTPPYDWHTYLLWFDRNNTRNGAAIRWTPYPGVTQCMFKFLYEPSAANTGTNLDGTASQLPLAGQGCYIDDLVLDAVPANLALESVPQDTVAITIPPGGFAVLGGVPTVTLPSATGKNYRLVYKDKLTDPGWTVIGTTWTPGTGNNISLTDPAPNPAGRFYRVEVQ